eukprot:tig00000980_g6161.t1
MWPAERALELRQAEDAARRRAELGIGPDAGRTLKSLFSCSLFGRVYSCFEGQESSSRNEMLRRVGGSGWQGPRFEGGVDPVEARLRDWQSETRRRAFAGRGRQGDPMLDDMAEPLFDGPRDRAARRRNSAPRAVTPVRGRPVESVFTSGPANGYGSGAANGFANGSMNGYGSGGQGSGYGGQGNGYGNGPASGYGSGGVGDSMRGRSVSAGRGGSRAGSPGPGRSTSPWRERAGAESASSRRSVKFDLPPESESEGERTPRRDPPRPA